MEIQSSDPTPIPEMKSLPMETFAMQPYKIMAMPGGINGVIEPFSRHFRDQHFGFHGCVSQVGTGQAAHNRGKQYIYLGQSAGQVRRYDFTEIHDTLCNPGIVHDNTGADKERDGQQGDLFRTQNHLLCKNQGIDIRIHQEINQGSAQYCNKYRNF